jgi:hypothetical protein
MPEWIVHLYVGENFCRIRRRIYEEVNEFVDENIHDVGRIIVGGRWLPEPLLYLSFVSYERWGYEGLKAVLHHHILDYSNTLAAGGKYGWLIKYRGVDYAIVDVVKLCVKVLENIERDFAALLNILKRGMGLEDVVLRIEEVWGPILHPKDFKDILRNCIKLSKLLEDVLGAVGEMRGCIDECVEEVLWLEFWGGFRGRGLRDCCPICMSFINPSDTYMLIPADYVEKDLAYRVHKKCFEYLKARAWGILNKGLAWEEVLKKISDKSLPPSIKYEVLKAAIS